MSDMYRRGAASKRFHEFIKTHGKELDETKCYKLIKAYTLEQNRYDYAWCEAAQRMVLKKVSKVPIVT